MIKFIWKLKGTKFSDYMETLVKQNAVINFRLAFTFKRWQSFWSKNPDWKFNNGDDGRDTLVHNLPNTTNRIVVTKWGKITYEELIGSYSFLHREDGPAMLALGGHIGYWHHGKLHRIDGPAVTYMSGITDWYINDRNMTMELKTWAREMNIDLDNLSDDDKIMIELYWGTHIHK